MCEPTTIMIASMAATALGGGVSALGAIQQGQAAAAIGRQNQQMAEYAAQDAQRRGEKEAIEVRRRADQVGGAQRNRLAANGVDIGFGTADQLVGQTDFFGEQDVGETRNNAAKDAWSLRTKGSIARFEGDQARRNSNWQAAGTLMSTAGQVADRWSIGKAKGVWG